MKQFCYKCDSEQKVIVVSKKESFKVKGEPIEVVSDIMTCSVCGEEIFNKELDEKNMARVYQEFRNKHNYLSPTEIKSIRSKYGSGRTVATLLGWSQNTLVRYENGAIPDIAHHEQFLRLKNDPNYIHKLLQHRGDKLKDQERYRLLSLLGSTSDEDRDVDPVSSLLFAFKKYYDKGITNTDLDFEKLAALVQLFANLNNNLVKTKLQKLLFYADFLSTKRYGRPISGLVYVHHHYGPVPVHHDLIQWALLTNGDIDVKPFDGPYEGEVIIPTQEPDLSLFSEEELEVIHDVAGFFHEYTAAKISEFSHEEKAYVETSLKEIIPFSYAPTIKLDR